MRVKHDICPYTLKPLIDLASVSDEHIFPYAIGGTGDYVLRVDGKKNSELGTTVDEKFVNSFILAIERCKNEIKSRSGPSKLKLKCTTNDDGRIVEATFTSDGKLEVRHIKPVEFDALNQKVTVIVAPEEQESFLAQLASDLRRKGKTFEVISIEHKKSLSANTSIRIELNIIKQGLLKIAFLAACEHFGDAFLSDPLIPDWHEALFASPAKEISDVKIKSLGCSFSNSGVLIPGLKKYEHGVVICNVGLPGPIAIVRLFDCDLLTDCFVLSETSNYGINNFSGKVVVCDTKARRVRTTNFDSSTLNEQLSGVPASK